MKLIYVIIRDSISEVVSETLSKNGYDFTTLNSTGGFLRRGNVTLLVGVNAEQVESVLEILKKHCPPVDDHDHGATIFVMDLPHYLKV
jgi:uncharacterized protein YaaQ